MRTDTDLRGDQTGKAGAVLPMPPRHIWFGGVVVRTIFLVVLLVLTARVASPQIETYSSLYETPGDFIRVAMGFGVCWWIMINLFILPKDPGAYRTWIYMGLALLPLLGLCAWVVW